MSEGIVGWLDISAGGVDHDFMLAARHHTFRNLGALAAAAGVAALLTLLLSHGRSGTSGGPAVASGTFTRYVAPRGSNHAPGTLGHPWRTLGRALRHARPGETIVLKPGVYGVQGVRMNWTVSGRPRAPITIRGWSRRQRPVILGYTKIVGSHLRVRDLAFLRSTGAVDARNSENPQGQEVKVWIAGSDVALTGSEVAGSLWHAGIYVTGSNVRLIANYIHDNGAFSDPSQANLDHGIYWDRGHGGLIADNLIVHNLADGIQLYPEVSGVTVAFNTIVGNGKAGVIVADQATDNTIVNNIVADNADNSIRSSTLSGTGNIVENNLVWGNGSGNIGTEVSGLRLIHNIQEDPRFVADGDYRLRSGSPAIGRAWPLRAIVPYDINGVSRGSRPDLGAFQG